MQESKMQDNQENDFKDNDFKLNMIKNTMDIMGDNKNKLSGTFYDKALKIINDLDEENNINKIDNENLNNINIENNKMENFKINNNLTVDTTINSNTFIDTINNFIINNNDNNLFGNETIEIDNQVKDDEKTKNNDNLQRYEKLMKYLGLNININYPTKILVEGIIELTMININKQTTIQRYSRCYKFRDDEVSKSVQNVLIGRYSYYDTYSYNLIARELKKIIKMYKMDKIANMMDKIDKNTDLIKKIDETIGFNYNNPRWTSLKSMIIE